MDINQLPEEILERIFSFTSQYQDYKNISLVCMKWYRIVIGLRQLNRVTFNECLLNGQIYFRCFERHFSPTQRHSHSSAILNDKLYIFGGLSATSTSYNDLWTLDMNTKTWSRPATSGNYPSPKAAASMLAHKHTLILYGGYSHPYSYPFNQQANFFDEFHVYDTKNNLWSFKLFSQDSPKLAGHSASIIQNNKLILFGGCNSSLGNKTNSVHCLDMEKNEWIFLNRKIDGSKPEPRYGHSQISLDDERVLIVGGCGGPNKQYDDVWVLNWPKDECLNASWHNITVKNLINSPTQLYCIPFVVCENNKIVTLGKPRSSNSLSYSILHSSNIDSAQLDQPMTIYTSSKEPQERKCTCSTSLVVKSVKEVEDKKDQNKQNEISNLNLLNKSQRNTIKRLEALQKIANKFNKLKDEKETKLKEQLNSTTYLSKTKKKCVLHSNIMQLFVMDISDLFDQKLMVNWQTPIACFSAHSPSDTILYSLTKGLDELIIFGGMELDSQMPSLKPNYDNYVKHKVTNKMFILKPKSLFISALN